MQVMGVTFSPTTWPRRFKNTLALIGRLGNIMPFDEGEFDLHGECRHEIERLRAAFEMCHGALLCIGAGNTSNWSSYAANVAEEASSLVSGHQQSQQGSQ